MIPALYLSVRPFWTQCLDAFPRVDPRSSVRVLPTLNFLCSRADLQQIGALAVNPLGDRIIDSFFPDG